MDSIFDCFTAGERGFVQEIDGLRIEGKFKFFVGSFKSYTYRRFGEQAYESALEFGIGIEDDVVAFLSDLSNGVIQNRKFF